MRALAIACVLGGCTSLVGIDDFSVDDPPDPDPDSDDEPCTGPAIKISGALFLGEPLKNYAVALVQLPKRVRLAEGTTDDLGDFAFTMPTCDPPVEVQLEIPASTVLDLPPTIQHFAGPLTTDTQQAVRLLKKSAFTRAAQEARDPRQATAAMVHARAVLEDGTITGGASLAISPAARVAYGDNDGRIDNNLSATDGTFLGAYVSNAAVGTVTVRGTLGLKPIKPITFSIPAANEAHLVVVRL